MNRPSVLTSARVTTLADAYRERVLASDSLLAELTSLPVPARRARLEAIVRGFLTQDRELLSRSDETILVDGLVSDMAGLGPLEPLLADGTITEIMVNGPDEVYIERNGQLTPAPVRFRDERHLRHVAQTIVSPLGRRLDESNPLVDGRLPDGSRVNAVIPPLSLRGTLLTIRRFRPRPWTLPDLVETGALTLPMAELLAACVRARLNVLISGGTSSGKTSLLCAMAGLIPKGERVITVEDMAEIRLDRPHVVPMEARPANSEGRGEVTIRELVRNALRMRPDRIIVGEVRGNEVLDMLQALNTGHEGSLTTVHANSAPDALSRLEALVVLSGAQLPVEAIRQHMLAAIDVIIQAVRLPDGSRRIAGIYEVVRDGGVTAPRPVYEFRQSGRQPDGTVIGQFVGPLGRPDWIHRFTAFGVEVPEELGGEGPCS